MTKVRKPVGFIGLGAMGEPMAINLAKAGTPLVVWNRSPSKCLILAEHGASIAEDPADVFARSEVVIVMLVDGAAIDAAIGRSTETFAHRVNGRLLVNMATTEPKYSHALEQDIIAAGGDYVEAPVSGSKRPAELGQLVAMLAGSQANVDYVRQIIKPMCKASIACGAVPSALQTKLAVNLFLTATVAGLAESVHFADSLGLDLNGLMAVLDAGPLASDVSRIKLEKLISRDFSIQASIANVLDNVQLIADAAREAKIASPVLDVCLDLFSEAKGLGMGESDMAAVIGAIEHRTSGRLV